MTPATSSYLVCATQRSGSTLLCEYLKETGIAGQPEEFFEARVRTGHPRTAAGYFRDPGAPDIGDILGDPEKIYETPEYSTVEGMDYADHLIRSFELGTTPNGVFGAKLMWGHLDDFTTFVRELPAFRGLDALEDLLPAVFPKPRYVWVTRRDKVRQAVSLWKAIQNRAWQGPPGEESREPVYHEAAIGHLVKMLQDHDTQWEAFWSRTGIEPLTIRYEDDLATNPEHAVRRVLRHLDLPVPPGWQAPEHMSRQADERSERWVSQYRERRSPTLAT